MKHLEKIEKGTTRVEKPKWIRVKLPTGKKYTELRGLVDKYDLHTICTSGSCPNMGECWSKEPQLYDFGIFAPVHTLLWGSNWTPWKRGLG